jgi:hypothetical protein
MWLRLTIDVSNCHLKPETLNIKQILRYFYFIYDFIDNVNRSNVFRFRFIRNTNSMTQYIMNNGTNIPELHNHDVL